MKNDLFKPYYKSKDSRRAKRLKAKRVLINHLGGECIDCGYRSHLAALDFDHLEGGSKRFNLSFGLNEYSKGKILLEELFKEAEKCVIRCANCHRIKTHPDASD